MGLTLAQDDLARRNGEHAPKRVLLVNPWSTCHGGTSMVLLEFVKHLDRRRFDPTVLCPAEGELPETSKLVSVYEDPEAAFGKSAAERLEMEGSSAFDIMRRGLMDMDPGSATSTYNISVYLLTFFSMWLFL